MTDMLDDPATMNPSQRRREIAAILADDQGARRIVFDASDITDWDTALAVFLWGVQKIASEQGIVCPDCGAERRFGVNVRPP